MKLKTTVSEKTLADYDAIMGTHTVSDPYTTNGDCFRGLVESEVEDDAGFVLDVEWLDDEMRHHIERFAEMIAEAKWNGESGIPEARKDLAKFKRQYKAWVARAESCPVREIEVEA